MKKVRRSWARTGKATRRYMDLRYRTLKSWSRSRRVIAKAEYLDNGENPRFVVTSLSRSRYVAREVYEDLYCLRGEMENRVKEQQLYLFADRTSSATIRANQLRLWFSSLAYVFLRSEPSCAAASDASPSVWPTDIRTRKSSLLTGTAPDNSSGGGRGLPKEK